MSISRRIQCTIICCLAIIITLEGAATSNTNHCPLECFHGGACFHDSDNSYFFCECPTGYTGVHCEAPVVLCSNGDRCLNNGECKDKGGCSCVSGFGGEFCQEYEGPCDPKEPEKFATAECSKKTGPSGAVIFLAVAGSIGGAALMYFVGRYLGRRSSMQDKSFASSTVTDTKDPSVPTGGEGGLRVSSKNNVP